MARIRTLKPGAWQDERVGDLSHGARLLWIGLITMADDEGRLRELPTAINGHVFPHDNIANAKLVRWLVEIEETGMIVRYEAAGKRYIDLPNWRAHQRVDRPSPSELPAPPSTIDRRTSDESFVEPIDDALKLARTRASSPIPSSPVVDVPNSNDNGDSKPGRKPSKPVDQDALPSSLPEQLHSAAAEVHPLVAAVYDERGGDMPTLRGVALAVEAFPDRDHLAVARDLQHWALAGKGRNQTVVDWARTYRTFLRRAVPAKAARPGNAPAEQLTGHDKVRADRAAALANLIEQKGLAI
jgi:hypothetical protein